MSTAPIARDDQIKIMANARDHQTAVVKAWKSNAAFLASLRAIPPKAFEGAGSPTAHRKTSKCG
jgi:hypothetical protein